MVKDSKVRRSTARRVGQKPLLDGVSIFDLIIPWKEKPKDSNEGKGKQSAKKTTQTSLSSFLSKNKSLGKEEAVKTQVKPRSDHQDIV
jgi:hypothetical protein